MADRWEDRRNREDRGTMDRAGDEVRSWFGDDEATQRRRMDELRDERRERERSGRASNAGERAWERTRETARDITDRDRDGRRGFAEWTDSDRPSGRGQSTYSSAPDAWSNRGYGATSHRDEPWTRERPFGDTARYATADPDTSSRWSTPSRGAGWQETNYAGRGPRGYRRGDERIREDLCDRLTEDPRVDASDIDVQVKDGEVTLSGSVRSRPEKRLTEDLAEAVSGVREVSNNLKVKAADEVLGTARSGASVLGLTETPPPPKSK